MKRPFLSAALVALAACGDSGGGDLWLGAHGERALSFREDSETGIVELRIAVTGGECGNGSTFEVVVPGPIPITGARQFEATSTVDDISRTGCGVDGSCAAITLRGKLSGSSAEGTLSVTQFRLGGPPCLSRVAETWQARRTGEVPDASGPPLPDAQIPAELPGITIGAMFNEEAVRARVTPDNGVILVGHRFRGGDPTSTDALAVKLSAAGDVEWQRSGSRDGPDGFADVLVLPDGYVFAGHSSASATAVREPYLMRTDDKGAVLWNNVYRTDQPAWLSTIHLTPAGGLVGFGTRYGGPLRETAQVLILRAEADGTMPTGLELGVANGYDSAVDAVATSDGGFAVTGATPEGGGRDNAFLAKLDASFGLTWVARFGGPLDDVGNAVVEADGGGFLVAGTWPLSTTDEQAFLARIDAGGQLVWQRLFGGAGIERGFGASSTPAGLVLCGVTFARGSADIYIVRAESATAPESQEIHGGRGFDGCWHMTAGAFAGSSTSRGLGGFDMFLLRF